LIDTRARTPTSLLHRKSCSDRRQCRVASRTSQTRPRGALAAPRHPGPPQNHRVCDVRRLTPTSAAPSAPLVPEFAISQPLSSIVARMIGPDRSLQAAPRGVGNHEYGARVLAGRSIIVGAMSECSFASPLALLQSSRRATSFTSEPGSCIIGRCMISLNTVRP